MGVSAGIAYGVSYLSGQKGRNLDILTTYANDRRYMGARNLLDRHNRSYFGLKFAYEEIPNKLIPFDYDAFAAWPGEAEAVVTSLESGRADYLPVPRRDESFLLLQATCAMPLLFPTFDLGDGPVLDGGGGGRHPLSPGAGKGLRPGDGSSSPRERGYHKKPEKLQPLIEPRLPPLAEFPRGHAQPRPAV